MMIAIAVQVKILCERTTNPLYSALSATNQTTSEREPMDDKKMKIRVVVQPEETRRAAEAAEREREARSRRARYGVLALSGLVAASLFAALVFFLGGDDDAPSGAGRSAPLASAPASSEPAPSASPADSTPASTATSAPPADGQAAPPMGASLAEGPNSDGSPTADGATGVDQSAQSQAGASATAGMGTQQDEASGPATKPAAAAGGTPAIPGSIAPSGESPASAPAPTARPLPADRPAAPALAAPSSKPAPSATPSAMAPTPAPAVKGTAGTAPTAAAPANQSASVARAQLTSRVVGREPVDTLRSPVYARTGRDIYYFTDFRDLDGHTVVHRWEYNGQVLATIPFRIGGDRWRVYSSKRVGDNQTGPWRVSAVDKNGTVLAIADFVVE